MFENFHSSSTFYPNLLVIFYFLIFNECMVLSKLSHVSELEEEDDKCIFSIFNANPLRLNL